LSSDPESAEFHSSPGAYVCDRCGKTFDNPQSLRDHQDAEVDEGDEEVQEEWEHTPCNPDQPIPSLGGDTTGDVV
jgi:hypothetical protein